MENYRLKRELAEVKMERDILKKSEKFDARTMCGSLCLQHKVNECLWSIKNENAKLEKPDIEPPMHINFI